MRLAAQVWVTNKCLFVYENAAVQETLHSWIDCKNLEGSCAGGPYTAGSDLTEETRCTSWSHQQVTSVCLFVYDNLLNTLPCYSLLQSLTTNVCIESFSTDWQSLSSSFRVPSRIYLSWVLLTDTFSCKTFNILNAITKLHQQPQRRHVYWALQYRTIDNTSGQYLSMNSPDGYVLNRYIYLTTTVSQLQLQQPSLTSTTLGLSR